MKRARIIMILYIMVFLLTVFIKFLYTPPSAVARTPISVFIGLDAQKRPYVATETVHFSRKIQAESYQVGLFKKSDEIRLSYDQVNSLKGDLPRVTIQRDADLLGFRLITVPSLTGVGLELVAKQDFVMNAEVRKMMEEGLRIGDPSGSAARALALSEEGEIRRGSVAGTATLAKNETLILKTKAMAKSEGDPKMERGLRIWPPALVEDKSIPLEVRFERFKDGGDGNKERARFNKLSFDFSGEKIGISSESNTTLDAEVENAFSMSYRAESEPPQGREYCVDITKKPNGSGTSSPDFDYFQICLLNFENPPGEFRVTYPPSSNWEDRGTLENPWTVGLPYNSLISATHAVQIKEFRRGNENLMGSISELPNMGRTAYRVAIPRILAPKDQLVLKLDSPKGEQILTWTVVANQAKFAVDPPLLPVPYARGGAEAELFDLFRKNGKGNIVYETREIFVFPQMIGVGNNIEYSILEGNTTVIRNQRYDPQKIVTHKIGINTRGRDLKIQVYSNNQMIGAFSGGIREIPDEFFISVSSWQQFMRNSQVSTSFSVVLRNAKFDELVSGEYWEVSSLLDSDKKPIALNDQSLKWNKDKSTYDVMFSARKAGWLTIKIKKSPFSGRDINLVLPSLDLTRY